VSQHHPTPYISPIGPLVITTLKNVQKPIKTGVMSVTSLVVSL